MQDKEPSAVPGRPVMFDRARITAVALRILQEEGLAELTMRRLASESDTAVASLYRHLGGRDQVLSAALDAYAATIDPPILPPDALAGAITVFTHCYDVLADRPWLVEVLRSGGQFGASAMWYAENFLRLAEELGLSEEAAVRTYRLTWSYVLGALLTKTATDSPAEREESVAIRIAEVAQAYDFKRTTAFLKYAPGTPRDWFIMGLQSLLTSLLITR